MRISNLALVLGLSMATPALAGPPWISIELPANPYDAATRGAFLVVHTYHHGTSVAMPLTGSAEGIVRGSRRTVPLRFESTSRTGSYAVRNTWGNEGIWTLVITLQRGPTPYDLAQALVEVGDGEVTRVRVPTVRRENTVLPATVTAAEIESGLRTRAAGR